MDANKGCRLLFKREYTVLALANIKLTLNETSYMCKIYSLFFSISVLVTYPIDIAFAISATSSSANELYTYMKNAITHITMAYGMYYVHHALMVFGSEAYVRITFAQSFNSTEQFNSLLGSIVRVGGRPDLPKALEKVADLFKPGYIGERPNVRKFLVVIVDRNTVGDENVVLRYAKFLENLGIKVGRSSYYGLILFVRSFVIKKSVVMSWNPVNVATNKQ